MKFQELITGFRHLLFPQLCAGCQTPLLRSEVLLCIGCQQELPRCGFHEEARNAAAMRLAGRLPFEHATSFAYFVQGGLLQYLLHRLKYQRQQEYGRQLGILFAWELEAVSWMKDVDVIIPVPLHPKKERMRGYNQAALIAGSLAAALQKTDGTDFLRRSRFTESQTRKSREERTENVAGAFTVSRPEQLKNKQVLLVDDVLTTGATMEAAAHALLQVPGLKVSFATIALAG